MSNTLLVSVVIPTYNEKQNVGRLIDVLSTELSAYNFEIIIVDDHSPDGTARLVRKESLKNKAIRLHLNPPHRGLSRSILFGLKKAKGEIIVGMDADFNHDPKIIKQLIDKLKTERLDLVVASRFIEGGGMDDKLRFLFTKMFNFILRKFFAFPSTDNASGYYAIRQDSLRKMPLKEIFIGYGEYHLRLVYLAKKMHFKIGEVPVFYRKRQYGVSKSKLLNMAFGYLRVAFQLRCQL